MKPGDFVGIHTEEQTYIAKMLSDDGDTITAEIGSIAWHGIPKGICELYVPVD